jgi:hypothetical protein
MTDDQSKNNFVKADFSVALNVLLDMLLYHNIFYCRCPTPLPELALSTLGGSTLNLSTQKRSCHLKRHSSAHCTAFHVFSSQNIESLVVSLLW